MNELILISLIYSAIVGISMLNTDDWVAIQTIAISLTGLVVIWYTFETKLLRKETQKQTELQIKPFVLAKLEKDKFHVTNYGHGVALNVKMKPLIVDKAEQIYINFNESIPILKSGETLLIEGESFRKGYSCGNFFLAHLDPVYANRELQLEVLFQNVEFCSFCTRERISPEKREIIDFKVTKT